MLTVFLYGQHDFNSTSLFIIHKSEHSSMNISVGKLMNKFNIDLNNQKASTELKKLYV